MLSAAQASALQSNVAPYLLARYKGYKGKKRPQSRRLTASLGKVQQVTARYSAARYAARYSAARYSKSPSDKLLQGICVTRIPGTDYSAGFTKHMCRAVLARDTDDRS
eukprot:scaffold187584_cov24-Tisochrysis_lutea.AAC.1